MPTAAIRFLLTAAFALVLFAAPARAAEKVKVVNATVGFPADGVAKFGAWAPVYVTVELQTAIDEDAELVFEAPDADEVNTTLAIPLKLAGLSPGTTVFAPDLGAMGYVRPAGSSSEVTIRVRTAKGTPLSDPFRVRMKPREPLQYVVLAVGGAPAGFELPKAAAVGGAEVGPLRNGRIELGHIADLAHLPDHWFGYDAADLVILNTSNAELLAKLCGGESRKREALLEWVRRGGRLVVSVGANAKAASALPHVQALLPYAINPNDPARPTEAAALYWLASAASNTTVSGAIGTKGGTPFAMANLVPAGKPARVLIPTATRKADAPAPVAVQAASGIGRVTVIGFDLDKPLFTEAQSRAEFWDWVLREGGAYRASAGGDGKARPAGALTEDEDEVALALRAHNDTFDGVAVVSFGWIAMLIVLYMLIIGPIEYYFLKRVFGRLELTWVTFPVIVLTVSAAAYLSADAAKGRELKVNKIDVVDVDPASNRIYGTTMFTVFSPKIDNYTISVTPGEGWGFGTSPGTVNALGAPRGGKPGIVRRKYAISPNSALGAELTNVPIQVWSTKSFSANWFDRIDDGRGVPDPIGIPNDGPLPVVISRLVHPIGDPSRVIGTFRHDFPVPVLTDCVAFYAGQAYPLPGGVIVSGEPVRLMLDQGVQANQWLQQNSQLDALLNNAQSYRDRPGVKTAQKSQQQAQAFTGPLPLWGLLFHEASLKNEDGVFARNASLRKLDQSWRLHADNRDEVIIVGRATPPVGPAEDVLRAAPSLLSLKGQPGSGDRWKIPGTARQETWVRFYLPVR